MDFGVEFVPEKPTKETVKYTKTADETGFEYVWVTDHYNNRNVYATLALIAEKTEKIKLGPGVTNPYTIHPAETASSVATLDELSEGRALLGIGPGDRTTLNALGLEWGKPLTRTEESIEIMRSLLAGESVTSEEEDEFDLEGCQLNLSPKTEIPIYVGAQGPKMLKMATTRGDGILINASHPRDFEYAIERVEKGIEEAEREWDEVDVAAYTSFSAAEDKESAKEAVIPPVAFIVAGVPKEVLKRHEISSDASEKIKKALGNGNFGTAFESVTDKMINAFSVYGTPDKCIERIKELEELGISQVVAGSPIGPDKKKSMEIISEEIMPEF